VDRTQVKVVFLADFRKLGVEVDLVSVDKALESLEIVVDDAVVEVQTPATAAATDAATRQAR